MRIIAAMGVPVMCICLSCGSLEQSSQVSGYDWVLNTACYNYDTVVRLLREKGLGETASIINKRIQLKTDNGGHADE